MQWQLPGGAYEVDDDPRRLDVERVWRWLSEQSYWAAGRPLDVVERSIAGSLNLGLFLGDEQVGFCRWVTDRATFAWLCDVIVDPGHRGQGLGTSMVAVAVDHPDVRHLGRLLLATGDAHGLYARFGFGPLAQPERWMERRRP